MGEVVRRTPHFTALFMLGGEDEEATVDNVDVEVTLDDGTRYSGTVLTVAALQRWMDGGTDEYEWLKFQCPDLVITRYAGVPAMMRVLELAHERDDLRFLLQELRPVEDEAGHDD
ncbi:hypothetical protein [Streptomyces sp. NPDC093105]|uniref:hypothetical protein n=1 Tax=Streptomyces sp. NPDC093105 TaxID=3366029 RepID=UPI003815D44E